MIHSDGLNKAVARIILVNPNGVGVVHSSMDVKCPSVSGFLRRALLELLANVWDNKQLMSALVIELKHALSEA